jgi:hypothetical protein
LIRPTRMPSGQAVYFDPGVKCVTLRVPYCIPHF